LIKLYFLNTLKGIAALNVVKGCYISKKVR